MKKMSTMILVTLMVLSLLSSNQTIAQSADGSGKRIAIVYSTGGKGDLSFNDAAYRGIQEAQAAYSQIEIDESEPSDTASVTTAIQAFADSTTAYDLVIGIGFTATDGITAAADAHTDQRFMIVDSVVDKPNVASITFAEHEGSFLVGALAALTTATNKLAFLGGLDIPLINKFRAGYEQGANYIANLKQEYISVDVSYSPNPDNPWGDIAGGKTLATAWLADDVDVIYAAAGGTGLGVMQAVNGSNPKKYAIGVDSDQDYLAKGYVLTSMIKKVETAVKTQIDAIVADTWNNGLTTLGLAEGGVGTSNFTHTQTEVNVTVPYYKDFTRGQVIRDLANAIKNGSLSVSDVPLLITTTTVITTNNQVFTIINGLTVVPRTVTTSTQTSFAIFGMLFAFLAVPTVYFVKRRK